MATTTKSKRRTRSSSMRSGPPVANVQQRTMNGAMLVPLAPLPKLSVVFNTPAGGGPDLSLENRVIELASHAKPGSKVRVAMFHWSRVEVAQAFVDAAKKRNVDVQMALSAD